MVTAVPLKAMGQFNHEAVCVDPKTGIVYQTEDRDDGLIYRFIPNIPGELAKGGKLQALAYKKRRIRSARNWKGVNTALPSNRRFDVKWIDLDKVYDLPDDDLRRRGYMKGATLFARGEGMWSVSYTHLTLPTNREV